METDKPTKVLYCVVYNRLNQYGEWVPAKHLYTKATSAAAARNVAYNSNQRRSIHIIAVAPAVGFFVNDKDGKVLSAT